jgi:hypothetical protein
MVPICERMATRKPQCGTFSSRPIGPRRRDQNTISPPGASPSSETVTALAHAIARHHEIRRQCRAAQAM